MPSLSAFVSIFEIDNFTAYLARGSLNGEFHHALERQMLSNKKFLMLVSAKRYISGSRSILEVRRIYFDMELVDESQAGFHSSRLRQMMNHLQRLFWSERYRKKNMK
jgi:hypothetical protein